MPNQNPKQFFLLFSFTLMITFLIIVLNVI